MGDDVLSEGTPVGTELLFSQLLVAADELSRVGIASPALTHAVLDGLHLHVVPIGPERRNNPTVMGHVPVPIGGALPDAQGSQVWGLQTGDVPLVDAVVGDAVQPDLAAGPGLD